MNTDPISLSFPATISLPFTHTLFFPSLPQMLVLHNLLDRFPDSWKGDED